MHDSDHPPHGLRFDLPRLCAQLQRRRALSLFTGIGLAGVLPLVACGGGSSDAAGTSPSSGGGSSGGSSTCSLIPDETAGPYPSDGSNSANGAVANALLLADIVRRDIRSSIGGLSGTAAGVPLTVTLTLVNPSGSCATLAGRAVYLWHCDRDGLYSMYSAGVTNQNYLRGVQVSDSAGQVTFQTIFPACYSGRWPHIHFEVFSSLATATRGANDIKTSQLALPQAACVEVFNNASGYSRSISNLAAVSLASDGVFGNDGGVTQLASVTGSAAAGYSASLTVGVSA